MPQFIVIGGGIVGSSAAYRLARSGSSVTLIDRADTGHATAAGAGIVTPGTSRTASEAWNALMFRAVAFYSELLGWLAEDGEPESSYEVVGELIVATNELEVAQLDEVYRVAEERAQAGVKNIGTVTRLSPAEARQLFPALRDDASAVHLSGAARVNGRLIRDALLRATDKHGGTLLRGDAQIVRQGDRVVGVRVDETDLPADAVILAGGAWSRQTAAAVGIDIQVYPQRGQILHLEIPGAHAERWPIVTGFSSHYMLTFPGSRVVAGATREDDTGYDYRVTAGGEYELLEQALRVAPGLGGGTIIETRVGFRPASRDGLALLGAIDGVEGLYAATGMGPSGLTLGPYGGVLVADLAKGTPAPFDLAPYAPGRFAVPHSPFGV